MALGFKIAVRPQHERRAYIKAQSDSSKISHTSYDVYEGKPTELTRIRVPIDLPLYRMANGRTQTQQLAYIAEHHLPIDHFESGEENEGAQQIQHEILRVFAREGTDSITPIIDELARTTQTEPILITQAGIVVNGNRRLAAMRELYSDPSGAHPSFASVECAILPPLSLEEVDDIEIRLQMRPETKLPYGWIDECIKIQTLIDRKRPEDEITRLMRKKKGDISRSLQALKYAEIYLKDWLKKSKDYRLVEAGEQFFNDLVTRLKGKNGEMLEANMLVAWVLFDNRTNLGSRIYDFNRVLGDKAAEVLTKLSERIELDPAPPAPSETPSAELEIDLGGGAPSPSPLTPLIRALQDEGRREEIADDVRAVCQTVIDASRTAKQGSSALGAVRDAHTRLTEVDLTKADPKTYQGIRLQLDEIIVKATDIQEKLKSYETSAAAIVNGTSK
jgi:hypothetical protein